MGNTEAAPERMPLCRHAREIGSGETRTLPVPKDAIRTPSAAPRMPGNRPTGRHVTHLSATPGVSEAVPTTRSPMPAVVTPRSPSRPEGIDPGPRRPSGPIRVSEDTPAHACYADDSASVERMLSIRIVAQDRRGMQFLDVAPRHAALRPEAVERPALVADVGHPV